MNMSISKLYPEHWPEVEQILAEGIATGMATFETQTPTWKNWDEGHLPHCRFIATGVAGVGGWIALSPVSKRNVYAGVAEVSVYIGEKYRGKGLGTLLFQTLVVEAEKAGIWTLQSSIFRENEATIALHKKVGFREVGFREKIAQHHGTWRDTVLLERRSKRIV